MTSNIQIFKHLTLSHMDCSFDFFFLFLSLHIRHAGVAVSQVRSIVQARPKTQNAAAFS